MAKRMCKLAKDNFHIKKPKQFAKLVKKPKFVCNKCGRVADSKDNLCKSTELK
jgi:hypothetical protein